MQNRDAQHMFLEHRGAHAQERMAIKFHRNVRGEVRMNFLAFFLPRNPTLSCVVPSVGDHQPYTYRHHKKDFGSKTGFQRGWYTNCQSLREQQNVHHPHHSSWLLWGWCADWGVRPQNVPNCSRECSFELCHSKSSFWFLTKERKGSQKGALRRRPQENTSAPFQRVRPLRRVAYSLHQSSIERPQHGRNFEGPTRKPRHTSVL